MHLNFEFGSGRRCLRIENGEAAIDTFADGRWVGYRPISLLLASLFLQSKPALKEMRRQAAWGAWQEVVDVLGHGPASSAVFKAVAGE